jgi:hypothetical protein
VDRLPEGLWIDVVRSVPAGRVEWNRLDVDTRDLTDRGFSTRSYGHISPVTYYRLLLPELLPRTLEKVLYLDSDVIVCEDIAPLWDTDIAEVDLAAAPELDLAGRPVPIARWLPGHDLGMKADLLFFNVGVLLINLRRWREARVAQRSFVCLRSLDRDIRWYDQDVINLVVNGRYRTLAPRWNARPLTHTSQIAHPVSILHFFTATKPWHWNYRWSCRERFFESLDRTPWAGWRPKRPRFGLTRLLLERATRVALKGRDAAVRFAIRHSRRWRYRLSLPIRQIAGGGPVPRTIGSELRLFLALPPGFPSAELRGVLESYQASGVNRVFILGCSREQSFSGPGTSLPVHGFRADPGRTDLALRHLLDQYGVGHWCVLGGPGVLREESGEPVDLPEWCRRLEGERVEAIEARTGTDSASRVELIARDLRSGRSFRGTALVGSRGRAWDSPEWCSRIAVLKYRKTMLLDRALVLIGNARRSERLLRDVTPVSATRPSSDRQAVSQGQRS